MQLSIPSKRCQKAKLALVKKGCIQYCAFIITLDDAEFLHGIDMEDANRSPGCRADHNVGSFRHDSQKRRTERAVM